MPKPLRRIGAQNIGGVSRYHSSSTMSIVFPDDQRQPILSDDQRQPRPSPVLERPDSGIVLTIASGPRAGEMIGTNEQEVLIGFNHDCLLRFPSEQYPHATTRLLLRRGTEGWYVLRVAGSSAFVNQHLLKDRFPLRSGDLIRLSSRGPDVQFTMHSGGLAVRALLERYLPQSDANPQATVAPAENNGQINGQAIAAIAADKPEDADPTVLQVGGETAGRVAGWIDFRRIELLWRKPSTKMAVVLLVAVLAVIGAVWLASSLWQQP